MNEHNAFKSISFINGNLVIESKVKTVQCML